MLYMNENDIKKIQFCWGDTIEVIISAVKCFASGDYSQPLKPYLRFGNPANRIIAMPAYVGGNIDSAGIKWISSFPQNIERSIPRAMSVTVLNNTLTGEPLAFFNTPLISIIRTVSVSGYIVQKYLEYKNKDNYSIGIIGWGPIGQNHYKMCKEILERSLGNVYIFDLRDIALNDKSISVCRTWQEVYEKADIFITCTSTLERYINLAAEGNKLILDVSLRDFKADALNSFAKPFIVDDWEEVNREDTDIEYYTKMGRLKKEDVISLCDVYKNNLDSFYADDDTLFFAPMGMGVFDVAIANYFYRKAIENEIGIHMN